MYRKIVGIFMMMLLYGTIVTQVSACTGFTASNDDIVLVGSNEDWHDNNFNLRFFPPKDGKNGIMMLEVADIMLDGSIGLTPFAGMNDQGLWFDMYATPYLLPVNTSDKPYFSDPECYYKDNVAEYALKSFSTIDEVIDIGSNYNNEPFVYIQFLICDASGNSVVYEGDDWFIKEGNFQVVSNFLLSHPELGGIGTAFERYGIAVSMLENMTDLSVDYFVDICDATHQQRSSSWTVYSWIADLKNQIIYFYYLHDYDNVVIIDLKEELEKGEHSILLGSLFEPEGNQGPTKLETPIGNESGSPGEVYSYRVRKVNDPDGDSLSYMWDWGDGTFSHWIQASSLGAYLSEDHIWIEEGSYEVRVKARDMYGAESEWSDPLEVSMPRSINIFNSLLFRLIQRFPILASLF